jgi:hypothetical protein
VEIGSNFSEDASSSGVREAKANLRFALASSLPTSPGEYWPHQSERSEVIYVTNREDAPLYDAAAAAAANEGSRGCYAQIKS